MGFQRALDYIDVATRLEEMRVKFPDLTMQQVKMEFISFGGKDWVVYTAAAFRDANDTKPGIGTAWEPVPGPTPYTKDSEVQNAETAAWGRALIAIGASTKNGIASAEEVTNRSSSDNPTETMDENSDIGLIYAAHDKAPEIEFLASLVKQHQERGTLTTKQLSSGASQALKILGKTTPRSAPLVEAKKMAEPTHHEPTFSLDEEPF